MQQFFDTTKKITKNIKSYLKHYKNNDIMQTLQIKKQPLINQPRLKEIAFCIMTKSIFFDNGAEGNRTLNTLSIFISVISQWNE